MSDHVTPREAAEGLRRGDFTRLAPLFGDAARPDVATGRLLAWVGAGEFDDEPDVLAEAARAASVEHVTRAAKTCVS